MQSLLEDLNYSCFEQYAAVTTITPAHPIPSIGERPSHDGNDNVSKEEVYSKMAHMYVRRPADARKSRAVNSSMLPKQSTARPKAQHPSDMHNAAQSFLFDYCQDANSRFQARLLDKHQIIVRRRLAPKMKNIEEILQRCYERSQITTQATANGHDDEFRFLTEEGTGNTGNAGDGPIYPHRRGNPSIDSQVVIIEEEPKKRLGAKERIMMRRILNTRYPLAKLARKTPAPALPRLNEEDPGPPPPIKLVMPDSPDKIKQNYQKVLQYRAYFPQVLPVRDVW
jgi:hypothetical protein